MSAKKTRMDAYLEELFIQFIQLKDADIKSSQEVFNNVFQEVKKIMGEKDNYFQNYGTQVMDAGSVYDGIKVSRLDEFDKDIVIRLPISYENGIVLESAEPGFVRMLIGAEFDNLDKKPDWEKRHKVTRDWRDADKYLLQNKFRQWMHGIVQKALNEMNGKVTVNGVSYLLKYKESGPAYTLNISNDKGGDPFNLDVDLVPVIKFQYPRWPKGYRQLEDPKVKDWLVVPKPNKAIKNEGVKNRGWRLSFQEFEHEMMKDCQQLKKTIRLVKKLRDALEMKAIASYYIKTLFLWKVHQQEKSFWRNKLSLTFKIMVEELRDAIHKKNIPYFWHEKNNLIEGLKPTLQKVYLDKLNDVVNALAANDADKVVKALLTPSEVAEFKKSKFYLSQPVADTVDNPTVSRQQSTNSNSSSSQSSQEYTNGGNTSKTDSLIKLLIDKIDGLTDKVASLEERMSRLEMAANSGKNSDLNGEVLELTADTRAVGLEDYQRMMQNNPQIVNATFTSNSNVQSLIDLN